MSKRKNLRLFKEQITLTDYEAQIEALSAAIGRGEPSLTELLFGTETPELYSAHGGYRPKRHRYCAGLGSERYTEKRLCKCIYYQNSAWPRRCEQCLFQDRFAITGDYRIDDYEVPAFYYGDGVGKIDLVIRGEGHSYAAEVKPYKGNSETLLRMIAEIMTYTQGVPAGQYKRAIAFFEKNREDGEKTPQQKEYAAAGPSLLALLKQADIAVFRFEEAGERAYRICRL